MNAKLLDVSEVHSNGQHVARLTIEVDICDLPSALDSLAPSDAHEHPNVTQALDSAATVAKIREAEDAAEAHVALAPADPAAKAFSTGAELLNHKIDQLDPPHQ